MSREIDKKKIQTALEKGQKKALDVIDRRLDEEALRSIFNAAVDAAFKLVDNFTLKRKFIELGRENEEDFVDRGHDKKADNELTPMLIAAFQAVQMIYVLESHVNTDSPMSKNLDRRLLEAITIFRTNGKMDTQAVDIRTCVRQFRQKLASGQNTSGCPHPAVA